MGFSSPLTRRDKPPQPARTSGTKIDYEEDNKMAFPRGHRFPIEFADAFPHGLVLMGEVGPDNEYQSREDRAAGRPVRQRIDELTGTRQWKATVTDPDERNAKRASFEVTFLTDVQPVPSTSEVLPGVRPIELDGMTAEPRVYGNGEFKFQSSVFRATGFKAAGATGGTRTTGKAADTSKAA
jgi:hypothetical protein